MAIMEREDFDYYDHKSKKSILEGKFDYHESFDGEREKMTEEGVL